MDWMIKTCFQDTKVVCKSMENPLFSYVIAVISWCSNPVEKGTKK